MLVLSAACLTYSPLSTEPNPPTWPESVVVFGPGDTGIESTIAAAYAVNGGHEPTNHGQFSSARYAFLFKPGTYDIDVPVGYYTHVAGLGASPSDVTFTSPKGVYSEEQDYSIGGALSTFWRMAENFKTAATYDWQVGKGMMWAVSQAAPLRRVEVVNDLSLFEYQPPITDAGEASGGFMANMKVGAAIKTGHRFGRKGSANGSAVVPGSQQQWFARDSTVSGFDGGVWNMVFSGVSGAPPSHCGVEVEAPPTIVEAAAAEAKLGDEGSSPVTNVASTPTIAEKPYITIDSSGAKYSLMLPPLKSASAGADFDGAPAAAAATAVGFEHVFVAAPTDSAATINAKLGAGLHVVFTPGVYRIDEPLRVETAGQVLLGIGIATLVSSAQNVLVQVGDVDGVRIAGLLLQAGPMATTGDMAPALLVWGTGGYAGSASAPGLLHDLFARVGGPDGTLSDPVGVGTMVHVQSGHVIGDNLWLWRADHAAEGPVSYESNPCEHGLVVDGDDVTMYALAVEHTTKDLTQWNGERGRTYFYQSELPYDATQASFGDPGYCGYRVAPGVQAHAGYGVGVYAYFRDHNVTVASGIVCPAALESSFVAPLSVFLNGNGGIEHVINDKGEASTQASESQVHYVC